MFSIESQSDYNGAKTTWGFFLKKLLMTYNQTVLSNKKE